VGGNYSPVECIVKHFKETLPEVHVSNGVDRFHEIDRARKLSIMMGPVVLEVLHVPLV
jgi:hypothetical protein